MASAGEEGVRHTQSTVAVVGGGVGGFAVALALQKRGFAGSVVVFEKDAHFHERRQGYGLTLQQGSLALSELDLLDRIRAEDTPSSSHYIFEAATGAILGFFGRIFYVGMEGDSSCGGATTTATPATPTAADTTTTAAAATTSAHKGAKAASPATPAPRPSKKKKKARYNLHLPRQRLRQLLHDQLDPAVIAWGHKLLRYEEEGQGEDGSGGGVRLHFEGGRVHTADVVVGADGIFSAVRRQKLGDPLVYLGVLVVLGIVRTEHPLLHERVSQTVDGETRIFQMPFTIGEERSSMWQLSFPCEEGRAKELSRDLALLKAEVVARCGSWHAPIPDMLQATTLDLISGTPVYDRDPLAGALPRDASCSATGASGVTLLGDAAHPMSPFKGQGANQALLDSCALAAHLCRWRRAGGGDAEHTTGKAKGGSGKGNGSAGPGPPPRVGPYLESFEAAMMSRTQSKVLGSRTQAQTLHRPDVLSSEALSLRRRSPRADIGARLLEAKVDASCAEDLDARVMAVLNRIRAEDAAAQDGGGTVT